MKKLLYILILLLSLNLYCEKSDDAQSTPIQNQSQSEAPIPQKNINGVSIEGFISEEGSNITNSYESNFTLSAPEKRNVTADTFITVRGTNISCREIRFYVYNESISEYRYLQTTVTNTGSYEDHVYLRYGQGDYIIFIF